MDFNQLFVKNFLIRNGLKAFICDYLVIYIYVDKFVKTWQSDILHDRKRRFRIKNKMRGEDNGDKDNLIGDIKFGTDDMKFGKDEIVQVDDEFDDEFDDTTHSLHPVDSTEIPPSRPYSSAKRLTPPQNWLSL